MNDYNSFDVPPGCPDIVTLATSLWGEPTSRKDGEVRFGQNGSKCVKPAPLNVWHDHESNEGGGYNTLYKLKYGKMPPKPKAEPRARIFTTYDYRDEAGDLLFQVCRMDPKSFRQRRPDATAPGGWTWSVKGVRQVPYLLPGIVEAPAEGVVYVVEGEKDAEALARLGLVATCNAGGALKWRPELSQHLAGRHVVILPDNDLAGELHAEDVAVKVFDVAASVRIVTLPDLPAKGDVSDWLAAGGTVEALAAMVEATEPCAAPSPGAKATKEERARTKRRDDDPDDEPLTEGDVSDAFTRKHADLLRFDHTAGRWFEWTGTNWQREETRKAFRWAHNEARALAAENGNFKIKTQAGKAAFAGGVERLAQSDQTLAVTHEIWDRDPWLLGTPGGVVDLQTGRLRPADRGDFITKLTSVTPAEPGTPHPRWSQFLKEATLDDADLQKFLQQIVGYCLTGVTREHALFFVHGDGGNGKSVFLNTVATILGAYATTAAMDTFTASQSDRHPTDLAGLAGARMVAVSETEEGRAWAESRIKALTGGDKISARFMRQDFFEYTPAFKLMIVGNHKPVLRNVDEAARRRFNIIPFVHKPPVKDQHLEAKLRAEFPAILAWAVAGCLDWQANGMVRPAVVTEATTAYFDEQDTIRQWIAECCDDDKLKSATAAALFESWTAYALRNGERPGTQKWLSQALERQGYGRIKDTSGIRGRGFAGICVKAPPPPRSEPREPEHATYDADEVDL